MTDTIRAALERLISESAAAWGSCNAQDKKYLSIEIDRARAALAEPEPEGRPAPAPADGEVAELVALIRQIALACEPDAWLLGNMTAGQLARAADLTEAVMRELFLERQAAPVPAEGEVADYADFVAWLVSEMPAGTVISDPLWWAPRIARRAADLLEQHQATPVPVAVNERLPAPEDCDAEGFCWWFSPADPSAGTFGVAACWVLRKYEPEDDFRTHWLPAHALPLPAGEGEK